MVINGQPTVSEGVLQVWGLVIAHPDATQKLINWVALTPADDDTEPGTEFRNFAPDEKFMTVVVGVLPTGDGLIGYSDENENIAEEIADDFTERPIDEEGQTRYEVMSYRPSNRSQRTPNHTTTIRSRCGG